MSGSRLRIPRNETVHCVQPFQIRMTMFYLPIPTHILESVDRSGVYINCSQTLVEIGSEAAQFPEKEYINGIFVAVSWDRDKIRALVNPTCSIFEQ
jgi:hypothetical protein